MTTEKKIEVILGLLEKGFIDLTQAVEMIDNSDDLIQEMETLEEMDLP